MYPAWLNAKSILAVSGFYEHSLSRFGLRAGGGRGFGVSMQSLGENGDADCTTMHAWRRVSCFFF